ncbi:MAG: glutaredoxin domain-containing protein [Ancrocorticia sp.]
MYVYTTSSCIQCKATKRKLDQHKFFYIEIPVTEEIAAELKSQGFTGLPVVKTGTDAWQGFRPDKIKGLVDQLIQTYQESCASIAK